MCLSLVFMSRKGGRLYWHLYLLLSLALIMLPLGPTNFVVILYHR